MLEDTKNRASISVKLSQADKKRATEVFADLGLNLSTAISIFIRKSIEEGGLPFEVKDSFYNEANQAELNRRFKKVANNQGVQPHQVLI